MNFVCPVCGRAMPYDISSIKPHTEEHIMEVIKRDHPEWVGAQGVCPKCVEYYRARLRRKPKE